MIVKPLTEYCTLNMGQSPDSKTYNTQGNGLPFYQGNADFGETHPVTRVWCSAPVKVAEDGDILISVRAPIGAMNMAVERCCIGRGLAALTPISNKCSKQFLYYALQSKVDSLIAQGTGSTFKAISKKVLEATCIPAYSTIEQEQITETISRVDNTIAARRNQLVLLDQLVKSRFIELFGDPLGNDKGWKKVLITEVCNAIFGGGTPSKSHPEYFAGSIPWVSPKDMKSSVINDSIDHITEEAIAHSTTNLVPANSVLMVIRSGILKHTLPVAINSLPVTINQDMKAFVPNETVKTAFLMHFFKAIENDVLAGVRGVTADNIDFKAFQKRTIIVPPLALQEQFAAFVEQTDKSKLAVQKGLQELEILKKSLMQQYFG